MSRRNIELKGKLRDFDRVCKVAEELSGNPAITIRQSDTFYNSQQGRLKLRKFGDSRSTLVHYDRPNFEGPTLSSYDLLDFDGEKTKTIDRILTNALGVRGKVVKERLLYIVGQTRIHIDTVEELGHFVELEVVLKPEQSIEEGHIIAREIQLKLQVTDEDLIDCAYMDLLEKVRR